VQAPEQEQEPAPYPRGWFGVHQQKCVQCAPFSAAHRDRAPAHPHINEYDLYSYECAPTQADPGSGLRGVFVVVPAFGHGARTTRPYHLTWYESHDYFTIMMHLPGPVPCPWPCLGSSHLFSPGQTFSIHKGYQEPSRVRSSGFCGFSLSRGVRVRRPRAEADKSVRTFVVSVQSDDSCLCLIKEDYGQPGSVLPDETETERAHESQDWTHPSPPPEPSSSVSPGSRRILTNVLDYLTTDAWR
jgi:hypothetical protein